MIRTVRIFQFDSYSLKFWLWTLQALPAIHTFPGPDVLYWAFRYFYLKRLQTVRVRYEIRTIIVKTKFDIWNWKDLKWLGLCHSLREYRLIQLKSLSREKFLDKNSDGFYFVKCMILTKINGFCLTFWNTSSDLCIKNQMYWALSISYPE